MTMSRFCTMTAAVFLGCRKCPAYNDLLGTPVPASDTPWVVDERSDITPGLVSKESVDRLLSPVTDHLTFLATVLQVRSPAYTPHNMICNRRAWL